MSQNLRKTKREIEQRISTMNRGDWFTVHGEPERQRACQAAKILKRAGIIEFDVHTRAEENGGGFKVVAI